MRPLMMGSVLALLATLGLPPGAAPATLADLERLQARDDFAGVWFDGGVGHFRFVGEADGVHEVLLEHYGDESRFQVLPAVYTLAQLRALQDELEPLFDDETLDIREMGVDQRENRLDVGAYRNLQGVRAELAEYGDMVHVHWSQGGFIDGGPPHPETAVKTVDGVKLRLTLDRWPLVAGEPAWLTVKVRNEGDSPIRYDTSPCRVASHVQAVMLDETWRQGEPVDAADIRARGKSEYGDLRWRLQQPWANGIGGETVRLRFAPEGAFTPENWGCSDAGVINRLAADDEVVQRWRWDGTTLDRLGLPPEGLARIRGSFEFRRAGASARESVEVQLDVPVLDGRDPEALHPLEVVDAALADPAFAALIEPVDIGDRFGEVLYFDGARGLWVVGACADYRTKLGRWKAAAVDPVSGRIEGLFDRATGSYCRTGPFDEPPTS